MAYYSATYEIGDKYLFSHDEMNELNIDKPIGKIVSVNRYQMVLSLGKEWSWSDFWWKEKLVTIDFGQKRTSMPRKGAGYYPDSRLPSHWMNQSSRNDNVNHGRTSSGSTDDDYYQRMNDTNYSSISDSWTPSWGSSNDDSSSSSDSSSSFGGGDFGGGGAEGSYDSGSSDSGSDSGGGDSGGGDD